MNQEQWENTWYLTARKLQKCMESFLQKHTQTNFFPPNGTNIVMQKKNKKKKKNWREDAIWSERNNQQPFFIIQSLKVTHFSMPN